MNPRNQFNTYDEILEEFQAILQLETKAAVTYQQLAQDCGNLKAKKLLEKIGKEEESHVIIAEKLISLVNEEIKKNLK